MLFKLAFQMHFHISSYNHHNVSAKHVDKYTRTSAYNPILWRNSTPATISTNLILFPYLFSARCSSVTTRSHMRGLDCTLSFPVRLLIE